MARPVLLILTFCIAALLVAGCLDRTLAATGFSSDEFTAKQAVKKATPIAHDWRSDAKIAGVFALEASPSFGKGNGSFPSDTTLGDGRAPAWALEWVSGQEHLDLVIHSNGSITDRDDRHEKHGTNESSAALAPWGVDSDTALKALRNNATWARGSADATGYSEALGNNKEKKDGSAWYVVGFAKRAPPVIGVVDAATGDIISVSSFDMRMPSWNSSGWGDWSASGDMRDSTQTYQGTLTVATPSAEHKYVARAPGHQFIQLSWQGGSPTDGLKLNAKDPDGRPAALVAGTNPQGPSPAGSAAGYELDARVPGTYKFTVELPPPGVYADYTLVVGGPK